MPILTIAGILGFLAVALGAFGAHGLEGKLDAKTSGWWDTATLYALVHVSVLAAMGLAQKSGFQSLTGPALSLSLGIFLFSGSLYAMALGAPRWFGAITPVGGLCFLAGWLWLAFIGLKNPS